MKPESSFPCLQEPSLVSVLIQMHLVCTFPLDFPEVCSYVVFRSMSTSSRGLFPSGFLTKILYAFLISPMCATYADHVILFDLITVIVFGEVYSYETPHYASFSSILPLLPSQVQIFSSASCSQTPSNYGLPLVWVTKFHIRTKQQVTLWFILIVKFLKRRCEDRRFWTE